MNMLRGHVIVMQCCLDMAAHVRALQCKVLALLSGPNLVIKEGCCLTGATSLGSKFCSMLQATARVMNMECADPSDCYLDDRCDELYEEAWQLHEGRVEGVEVVHDEPLDVGAIMILVSHDHQVTIAQLLHVCVYLQEAETSV